MCYLIVFTDTFGFHYYKIDLIVLGPTCIHHSTPTK